MQPVIGSGFGNFSRVLGPWTDFFPSSGGLGLATSQFGVCIGTKIVGGSKGATIGAITIEPPFNIFGNNGNIPWKCYVVRGDVPLAALVRLSNKFQQAQNGWARVGDSDQDFGILWSKMLGAKPTANAYNTATYIEPQTHFVFPDLCGPNVGPGETMTVIFVPLFNETGVPGYGAANLSYTSLSVWGVYDRRIGGDKEDVIARSIPRGRVGG